MNIKKSLLVTAAVAGVGIIGTALPAIVSAETTSSSSSGNLVDKLAQKFNLKKEDVQAVFDEDKAARQTEKQQEISDRLQDAVDSNKITAEQKTLIKNKLKELQAARDSEIKDLQAWADQNKISIKYLMFGHKQDASNDSFLQKAVDSGSITVAQKTLIEGKQKEIQQKREAAHIALESWAKANNIDMQYLMGMQGHGLKKDMKPF